MTNPARVGSFAGKTVAGTARRNATEATSFATDRLSTDDLPEQDRLAIWREYCLYRAPGRYRAC